MNYIGDIKKQPEDFVVGRRMIHDWGHSEPPKTYEITKIEGEYVDYYQVLPNGFIDSHRYRDQIAVLIESNVVKLV